MAKKSSKRKTQSKKPAAVANKKIRVYVFKEGLGTYRVYPGIVVLAKNDDMELVNLSGSEATWEVPAGPFGNAVSEKVGNKQGKTKRVTDGPLAVEYQVKVSGFNAKGNSDPVIIIDL